jgi:hypothetical protein
MLAMMFDEMKLCSWGKRAILLFRLLLAVKTVATEMEQAQKRG